SPQAQHLPGTEVLTPSKEATDQTLDPTLPPAEGGLDKFCPGYDTSLVANRAFSRPIRMSSSKATSLSFLDKTSRVHQLHLSPPALLHQMFSPQHP
ncbi:hypothetical protein HispidOSU_010176, partial [Sigmodon hispidus]